MSSNLLKPREFEILQLMAKGYSNGEIAKQLYLGIHTVRKDARKIYEKLGVSGRAEAAHVAQQLGLLAPPQALTKANSPIKHNLPNQLSSFIDRNEQTQRIIQLLNNTRLLTLTGAGGIGKTRLSIHIAEQVLEQFEDGIYFVDLAPLTDSNAVPKAIANALGIIENNEVSLLDVLKQAINTRHILLLIDNFEHVINGAAIVSKLLQVSRNLKIMVTSREVLCLSGEQEYAIPPLNIAYSKKDTVSEAVRLFIQRTQLVRPDFELNDDNQDDIIEICKQMDGLPLAIELAAAQCRILSPRTLLKHLQNHRLHLKTGIRDTSERQRSLQRTIEWSYDLLNEDEKILFTRLSVFRGGRSLQAIEAICGHGLSMNILDAISSLVQKSLVQQVEDEQGEPRFTMLETLQEYASQQIEARNEASTTRRDHATYFMELAEQGAPELRSANQQWWYQKLDIEQNNLRHAMTWALSGESPEIGVRTVSALRDYWWYQGLHEEGWRWIERALLFVDDIALTTKAQILSAAAKFAFFHHDLTLWYQYGSQAFSIYQSLNDKRGIAWHLPYSDQQATNSLAHQIDLTTKAIEMLRDISDWAGQTNFLHELGNLQLYTKDYDHAKSTLEECLVLARYTGEVRRELTVINSLILLALRQGQFTRARKLLRENMILSYRINYLYNLNDMFWSCMVVFFDLGEFDIAFTLYGITVSLKQRTGQHIYYLDGEFLNPYISKLKTQLIESPIYQKPYDKGYKMSSDEAIQFTLDALAND